MIVEPNHSDYSVLFRNTLTELGFDVIAQYNCFEPPYDPRTGWQLKLPHVTWKNNTVVLLHFQDFVTAGTTGILELDRVQQHYGARSDRVIVTHWPHALHRYYSGMLNLIEFPSHEWQIIRNLRQTAAIWLPQFDVARTQAWQCLNGRKCHHRQRVARVLQTWGNGVLSLGTSIPLAQWPYHTYPGTENEENWMRLLPIYTRCAVNIVTETQYDTAPGIITEKTTMAMLAQQIPVVIGYAGIVRDCEEMGFDMFRDVLDLSYDLLPNHHRAEAALWLNEDVIKGKIDLAPYQDRLQAQREYVLERYTIDLEIRFREACKDLASRLL